jgi:hypothetical protein
LQVRDGEAIVRRFKTDLHNCVGYILDPKMLKESIKALYQKHVQEDIVSVAYWFFLLVMVLDLEYTPESEIFYKYLLLAEQTMGNKIDILDLLWLKELSLFITFLCIAF